MNEPSEWISPVVVVPKPNGDIRLCFDMRQKNQAVKRVHHPTPTIDELLQDMNESLVGWLVGCFGFNGPLRQYFSLYRAVSQREGERGEKG